MKKTITTLLLLAIAGVTGFAQGPVIVSYDPQNEQEESARPIVRIEFDKSLKELTLAGKLTVKDKNGAVVSGTQNYYVASNLKSVMHYIFDADLNPQETYTVTLASGIEDTFGNAMSKDFTFNFTVRPREVRLVTVLDDFNTLASSWQPPGWSGSTVYINTTTSVASFDTKVSATVESAGSVRLDYQWLSSGEPHLRWHNAAVTPKFTTSGNYIQYYLFGDGSNSSIAVVLRNGSTDDMWRHRLITINWVGWKLITWDLTNDPVENYLVGSNSPLPTGAINLSCYAVFPAPATERSYKVSSIYFSQLQVVGTPPPPPFTDGKIANWQNNKKAAVSMQWDGWYWGHGNIAIPELIKRGMTGTFFVTVDFEEIPADWDMVKYAADNGIEIANHSWTHQCGFPWNFDFDVDSAKVFIEKKTGKRVYTFAYPCGAWSYEYARRIEAAGHAAARGVYWLGNPWHIPYNSFTFSYNFEQEPGYGYYHTRATDMVNEYQSGLPLSTFPVLIQAIIDAGGMLPYFYHAIEFDCATATTNYCNTVKRFNDMLDILETFRNQIWITTYGDAIRYHREAKAASLREVEAPNGKSWTIKLTHTLPNKDLYDFPLTIMLKMNGVDYDKITQNGKVLDFTTFNDTIMFNAIPNGENILLEAGTSGIAESTSNTDEIRVVVSQNTIRVISSEVIKAIEIYSISGASVKSIQPGQATYQVPTDNLMQGVYIVKVATGTAQKNVKVIVR